MFKVNYYILFYVLVICFISICFNSYGQERNDNFAINSAKNLTSAASNNIQNHGTSGYFYNPKREIIGSEFLFENWNNKAFIVTKNKFKFKIANLNLNLKSGSFMSKINKDSVFTFNMENIDKIVVNNKVFKAYKTDEIKSEIFEVLFESQEYSILKKGYVQIQSGSPNPMVNRPKDIIKKKKKYYVLKDNKLNPIKLKKKEILKLVGSKNLKKIKQYVKTEKLSYTHEKDISMIIQYLYTLKKSILIEVAHKP